DLGKFNSMFCFYDTVTNKHSTALAATDRGYFESGRKLRRPPDPAADFEDRFKLAPIGCSGSG
ncbi:MAG: hypothetical protein AAF623_15975, partial [Planctomycetota bacterium]